MRIEIIERSMGVVWVKLAVTEYRKKRFCQIWPGIVGKLKFGVRHCESIEFTVDTVRSSSEKPFFFADSLPHILSLSRQNVVNFHRIFFSMRDLDWEEPEPVNQMSFFLIIDRTRFVYRKNKLRICRPLVSYDYDCLAFCSNQYWPLSADK